MVWSIQLKEWWWIEHWAIVSALLCGGGKKRRTKAWVHVYQWEKKETVVLSFIKFERGKVNKKLWSHNGFFVSYVHKSILILYKITFKNGFQCPAFCDFCSRFNYHTMFFFSRLNQFFFYSFYKHFQSSNYFLQHTLQLSAFNFIQ